MTDIKPVKKKQPAWKQVLVALSFVGLVAMYVNKNDATPAASKSDESIFVHYLVSTSPHALVWRDEAAWKESLRLYSAGVPPAQLQRLLACSVDSGTKIGILSGGFLSSTIVVTRGPHTGCKGWIDNSFIKDKPPK